MTHGWSAFGGADRGWQDVGLERRAWTLSQAVSGSVGSQGAAACSSHAEVVLVAVEALVVLLRPARVLERTGRKTYRTRDEVARYLQQRGSEFGLLGSKEPEYYSLRGQVPVGNSTGAR